MLDLETVKQMSVEERLDAIELLWDSLAGKLDSILSPDWHQPIIEERLREIAEGKVKFFTLDEVEKRLKAYKGQ